MLIRVLKSNGEELILFYFRINFQIAPLQFKKNSKFLQTVNSQEKRKFN